MKHRIHHQLQVMEQTVVTVRMTVQRLIHLIRVKQAIIHHQILKREINPIIQKHRQMVIHQVIIHQMVIHHQTASQITQQTVRHQTASRTAQQTVRHQTASRIAQQTV